MKISNQSFEVLKTKIIEKLKEKGFTPESFTQHYVDNKLGKDHHKRARWDALYASVESVWICDVLYAFEGMNDSHIDTVLRKIFNHQK